MEEIEFNDAYYMSLALKEAEAAMAEGEIPVGALIVCNKHILARTHNETERLNDVTAHAEMLAITAATEALGGKYLTNCTLYVTMEPCVMCAGALAWSQIGKIVYGATDSTRGFSRLNPPILHKKTEVVHGILEDECSRIVKQFFTTRR